MSGTEGPSDGERTPPDAQASADTVGALATMHASPTAQPVDAEDEPSEHACRYEELSLLGRGGMGEVNLCLDVRIGRQVARKVIRSGHGSRSDARIRFLREARIQAQLEHPSIVPVYDLGKADDGQTYFTMKRVAGQSLDRIVESLRQGHRVEGVTQRRLLGAFSQVCLTIDFAHERGVLHRDLKPANIMLGDYGEVYVLDWGLAKRDDAPEGAQEPEPSGVVGETAAGDVLGTPGYIAPEQLEGRAERRSDVYALGAILFELLTLERLHQGATPQALLVSALEGVDARPTARAPNERIAPELEEICVRATALAPEGRYASARALHDAVERYLEGDRDLELRQRRAAGHVLAAPEALAAVVAGDETQRAVAMREVGRTLGLDPGNRGALGVLAKLLATPPARLPPAATRAVRDLHLEQHRHAGRNAGFGFLSGLVYVPLIVLLGVVNWVALLTFSGLLIAAAGVSFVAARSTKRRLALDVLAMVVGTIAMTSLYPLFGPYLLLPTILHGQVVATSLSADRRVRMIGLAVSCVGLLAAAGLDLWSVIGPVTTFETTALVLHPHITQFPPFLTPLVLLVVSLGVIITSSVLLGRARDLWTAAERQTQLQTWHLQQMIAAPEV